MVDEGKLFKSIELHSLFDEDASQVNILKKLDELAAKIHPEDVFIFIMPVMAAWWTTDSSLSQVKARDCMT